MKTANLLFLVIGLLLGLCIMFIFGATTGSGNRFEFQIVRDYFPGTGYIMLEKVCVFDSQTGRAITGDPKFLKQPDFESRFKDSTSK